MNRRSGTLRLLLVAASALGWAGCAQVFGIDEAHEVPAPEGDARADGAHPHDATSHDATKPSDAGADTTAANKDAGDAGHPTDASHPTDAPQTCSERVAALLGAPIAPPLWGGLDLSNGGMPNLPGMGGLTIQSTDLAPCAAYVEPLLLADGVQPAYPGYRETAFGTMDGGPGDYSFSVEANLSTGVIGWVFASYGYSGTFSFHSRSGGSYGTHTYEVAIGRYGPPPADGGPATVATGGGYVKRDGVDFPADWSYVTTDSGPPQASAWANEIYDGIIATYSPGTAAIKDCATTPSTNYNGLIETYSRDSCLYSPATGGIAYLGVRPLALYLTFNVGTNQVNLIYGIWRGGEPDCTAQSRNAQLEEMDYGPVSSETLAGLAVYQQDSNPLGLTDQETNTSLCNGVAGTTDGGAYDTLSFGPNEEVVLQYNKTTGLDYTLSAVNASYRGPFQVTDSANNTYTMTIGDPVSITTYPDGGSAADGGSFTIDWPASQTVTPAAATTLSNAFCGASDTDCAAAGDCIVTYDAAGNMSIGFPCVTTNGTVVPLAGVVFPNATSKPSRLFVSNGNGQ